MATQTTQEIRKLYRLSLEMADLVEEILESRGEYNKEFLEGLERSFTDAKAGRVKKINSLVDLT